MMKLTAFLTTMVSYSCIHTEVRYTEKVFAESMRLYPPACAVWRQVIQDCKIARAYMLIGSYTGTRYGGAGPI